MLVKYQNCPHLFHLPNLREVIISTLLGEAVFVMLSRMAVLHCLPDYTKPICCFLLAFSHPILTDVKEYRCIIDFFFSPSVDDKILGLVRDISCLTVASCLVTFILLLVWGLWRPFDLQHYWSGCTPWQGPNDYFSSSLWVMTEETHFALLSHCWEIYLFLNVTDFIWS